MFDSKAALLIVPDLGRPVFGGAAFLAAGVPSGWVVTVLPLAGAVGAVGRAAGLIVGREMDVARKG